MDGDALVEAVREAKATELDRLGSEKALVAVTGATLERETVLARAAAAERRAERTFRAWADDADGPAREAFAAAADREADHHDRIVGRMEEPGTEVREPDPDALHEHLRGLEGTVERVGAGLVGRPLAGSRTLLQVVSFFVNEADEASADLFRSIRAETDDLVDEGAALLDEVCQGEDDWERAGDAAEAAIEVAYGEYADTLEGMGLDPKPVC